MLSLPFPREMLIEHVMGGLGGASLATTVAGSVTEYVTESLKPVHVTGYVTGSVTGSETGSVSVWDYFLPTTIYS